MSATVNDTPYRIICRCVPSPQSNSSVSPSRTSATDATLRSTVGRDADVPRKRRESDIARNIAVVARSPDRFLRRHGYLENHAYAEYEAEEKARQRRRDAKATRPI